jgi:dTDP-4-dehydrorhamnose 3,5-epimerase
MEIYPQKIEGVYVAESSLHSDERGFFREWFRSNLLHDAGMKSFKVEQANLSSSFKGTTRGIHYSLAAKGQAKWVTCVSGLIKDVVVDIRPDSKTYGEWIAIELGGSLGKAVLIGEGLGHGFISLAEVSTVAYLVSSPFSPTEEFEINPLDPALGIDWGMPLSELKISDKDRNAPTLEERKKEGKLPK